MGTGLGIDLQARKLSFTAAFEGLEGHKIGRRFWAYHNVDFGNYQMFQVGKLICVMLLWCLNHTVVPFHFTAALDWEPGFGVEGLRLEHNEVDSRGWRYSFTWQVGNSECRGF